VSPPLSIIRCQRQPGGKQAHRATHWSRVFAYTASAGVWLRAGKSEISAAHWGESCFGQAGYYVYYRDIKRKQRERFNDRSFFGVLTDRK